MRESIDSHGQAVHIGRRRGLCCWRTSGPHLCDARLVDRLIALRALENSPTLRPAGDTAAAVLVRAGSFSQPTAAVVAVTWLSTAAASPRKVPQGALALECIVNVIFCTTHLAHDKKLSNQSTCAQLHPPTPAAHTAAAQRPPAPLQPHRTHAPSAAARGIGVAAPPAPSRCRRVAGIQPRPLPRLC